MNSNKNKALGMILVVGMFLSGCGTNLWGTLEPDTTQAGTATWMVPTDLHPTATLPQLPPTLTLDMLPLITPRNTSTPVIRPSTPMPNQTIIYFSQSGDSLAAVAAHFGVQISEITSSVSLTTNGWLNPGTTLIIPNRLAQVRTTASTQIFPDSELVYSPSAQDFDIIQYVKDAGGKLSSFSEYMTNVGTITGAEGVRRIAIGSSINPRILLALIQYYTGWVKGEPKAGLSATYPLGYQDPLYPGLYQQLRLLVRELLAGYYGWRGGTLTELTFKDGSTLRLAPDLNAGSVSLFYFFSKHLNYADWMQIVDPQNGFMAFYMGMFGDPWERARATGPLFPPDMTQPSYNLPFEVGVQWTLTQGPHPAWEQESAWAALDFAPPKDKDAPNCFTSNDWVVTVSSGQIVRSESSYVVLDANPDGYEQTGWVVLYQHIATRDRIATDTWVNAGDRIGHPSCEGGLATDSHLHIARKYNGEWVSAGDPMPFILSGWTAHAGSQPGQGTLTKGDKTVTASNVSSFPSIIIRLQGE